MHLGKLYAVLPFALLAACGGSQPADTPAAATPEPVMSEPAAPATGAEPEAPAATATETAAPAPAETPAAAAPASAAPAPAAPAPAAQVTAASAAIPVAAAAPPAAFAVCRACHAVEAGKNGVGPTLAGIVGSKAGEVPGYAFSPALKKSGIVWDRAKLDTWLQGPMKMVPGTKMVIAVPDAAKRKAIIDYLETL